MQVKKTAKRGPGRPRTGRKSVGFRVDPRVDEFLRKRGAELGVGYGELARRILEWTIRNGIPEEIIIAIRNK